MCLRAIGLACVLVLCGAAPSYGQQRTGPRTLEGLLNSDEPQKPAVAAAEADATDAGPKRPAGTLVRPKDGVKHPDLDKAWTDYDAAVAKVTESIKAAIAKQFDAATAKGDLDAAEKWQVIGEKFEKAGELPTDKEAKTAVSGAVADYKKAREELTKVYEAVVKNLTMEKKIAEAKAVRGESLGLVADSGFPEKERSADGRETRKQPTRFQPGCLMIECEALPDQSDAGPTPIDLTQIKLIPKNAAILASPYETPQSSTFLGSKDGNVIAHGHLKVDKAGRYRFSSGAWWGRYYFLLDGALRNKPFTDKDSIEIDLDRGMHEFLLVRLKSKDRRLWLEWQPPGEIQSVPIPASAFYYDMTTRPDLKAVESALRQTQEASQRVPK